MTILYIFDIVLARAFSKILDLFIFKLSVLELNPFSSFYAL
ncbi:hypothetical protein Q604_UNBC05589G0001, partial [human gut metagenome]